MGSSGYGRFGNYGVSGAGDSEQGTNGGGNGAGIGSNLGPSLDYIRLEDVAISEYYLNRGELPRMGETVKVRSTLYKGRLAVELSSTSEIIGNIPTEYNLFFLSSLKRGVRFSGQVVSSGKKPVPYIVVSLHE